MTVSLEKLPHPPEVLGGKTAHLRELLLQIASQPLNDGPTPGMATLSINDYLANIPIEINEFPVNRTQRLVLCRADARLDIAQK